MMIIADPEPLILQIHKSVKHWVANMKSAIINIMKRIPYLSMLLTAAALGIHIHHSLRPHLLYTRAALQGGDLWRLVSCHWVHLNTDHLLWSALTFFLLGSICEIMDRIRTVATLAIAAVFIPIAVWIVMPHLEVYGGLSGLDCSLYSLVIGLFIKREWHIQNWVWILFYTIMLALLPFKIIYEMTSGLTIFVNNIHINMVPVPLSHLVGGLVGFAVGMLGTRIDASENFAALDLHIIKPACNISKSRQ
jgi:rhomboid family GlyGly-CTERM serine protease